MVRRHHMDSGGPWMGLLLICLWASLCSGDKSPWFWTRDERPRENNWQCGSIIRPNGGPQPESYRFAFGDLTVRGADFRNEISFQKQTKKSDESECAVVIVGPSFNSRMVVRVSLMTVPGRDDCRITNALTLYDLQSGRLIIRDTACGKEKMSAVMQTTKNVGLVTVDLGLVRKGSFVVTVLVTDSLLDVPAQQINIPPQSMGVDPALTNDFNSSDSPILSTNPPLATNTSEFLNSSETLLPDQEQNHTTEIPPEDYSQTTRPMEMESDSAGSLVNSTDIDMAIDSIIPTDIEGELDSTPPRVIPSENPPPDDLENPFLPTDIEGESGSPPPRVIPSKNPPPDDLENPFLPTDIEGESGSLPPRVIPSKNSPPDDLENPFLSTDIERESGSTPPRVIPSKTPPPDDLENPFLPTDIEGESSSPPPRVIHSENSPPDDSENPLKNNEMNSTDAKENLGTPISVSIDSGKPIPSMEGYEDTEPNHPEQESNKTTVLTHDEDRETNSFENDFGNAGPIVEPADEELPPGPFQPTKADEEFHTLPTKWNPSENSTSDEIDKPPVNSVVELSKLAKNSSMSQSGSDDTNIPMFAMEGYENMALFPIRLQEKLNDSNVETASSGSLESSGYEQMSTTEMTPTNLGHQTNVSAAELNQPENLQSSTHGYGPMPASPLPPVENEEVNNSLPETATPNPPPQFSSAGETTSSNYLLQTEVEGISETMEEGVRDMVTPKPPVRDGLTASEDELEADLGQRLFLRIISSTPSPITARGLTALASATELLADKATKTSAPQALSTLPITAVTTQSQDGMEGASTMIPNLFIDAASTTIISSSETSMTTDTTSVTEKTSQSATTPLSNVDYVSTFSNMPISFSEASTLPSDFTEGATTFFTIPVMDTTAATTTTFPGESVTSTTPTAPSIYATATTTISSGMIFEGADAEEEWLRPTTAWRELTANSDMHPVRKETLSPPESLTTTIRGGPEVNTSGDNVSSASSTTQVDAEGFPHGQVGRESEDSTTGISTDETLNSEDYLTQRTTLRDVTAETIGIQKLENLRTVPDYLTIPDAPLYDEATLKTAPQDNEFFRTNIS